MTLLVLLWFAVQAARPLSGEVPSGISVTSRVVFIPARDSPAQGGCDVQFGRWICYEIADGSTGLVAFVGPDNVAWTMAGTGGPASPAARWGRVVQVLPGAVALADLHDLTLTPLKPDRPRLRAQARQFLALADEDVRVVKLSNSRFWVSGRVGDPQAFLVLEGPAIGSHRLATARLPDDTPEQIIYVDATLPAALQGFVQGAHGENPEGADVELMEVLDPSPDVRLSDDTPVIHRASTSVAADGGFRFERVTGGPFRIAARHPRLGRAAVWTPTAGPPIAITLAPSPRVKGRLLRNRIPVAGARVRFVPDVADWAATADAVDLVTAESLTDEEGRFVVNVPPSHSGVIQMVTADASVARIAVPAVRGEWSAGDVVVQDRVVLLVRMIGDAGCTLVAAGPLGTLGLAMVRGTRTADLHQVDLPEHGAWALAAECRGQIVPVEPPMVSVPTGDGAPVDVRLGKPPDS
jgi:hypothetical protein